MKAFSSEEKKLHSKKQILKSSFIIGGASVINAAISLLRMKVIAMILGPAGVGLVGVLNNVISTGSAIAAVGVNSAGTRQIAEANAGQDRSALDETFQSLVWLSILLAIFGCGVFWLARLEILELVLGDSSYSWAIGWLALGVFFTVLSGALKSSLTGVRQISEVAKVTIYSSLIGTVLGASAVYLYGEYGVVVLLVLLPASVFSVSFFYVLRSPFLSFRSPNLGSTINRWKGLLRLGSAFMFAGLAGTLGDLVVRSLVQRNLGIESLGYLQASWTISMTYVGLVLASMGADYYPRLTAIISDKKSAKRLVNEQSEISILLAGPVMLAILSLSPLIINLLYSKEFLPSVDVLRLQILGDVLRVLSWPLGFVIIASGKGKLFVLSEVLITIFFVFSVWLLVSFGGLKFIGAAFLLKYLFYVPVVWFLAWKLIGFSWSRVVKKEIAVLVSSAIAVFVISGLGNLGFLFSIIISVLISTRSFYRISKIVQTTENVPVISKIFTKK